MNLEEAERLLKKVDGWRLEGSEIQRVFKFRDFRESIKFVNQVAELAEKEGHHPDVRISWNSVTLTLTTHAIQGLSQNDFILAAKINEIDAR